MKDSATKEQHKNIHLSEYEQLKNEQIHRIGFRDNLIYVMLTVCGVIFSYALSKPEHHETLLVLPWACFILGWTYMMNDEKISSIGAYISDFLSIEISSDQQKKCTFFNWESYHKNRSTRTATKLFQLFVDLSLFCFSGAASLILFYNLSQKLSSIMILAIVIGAVLLFLLFIWFMLKNKLT